MNYVLVPLIFLFSTTYSLVVFRHSFILDEYDFNVDTINITTCPTGCNIYVSYNKDLYLEQAKKIYVVHPYSGKKYTFAEIAEYEDEFNEGCKGYFESKNWPLFKIVNENENYRSFPVLFYAVRPGTVNLYTAEVYDAHNMKRDTKPVPGSVITIMNVDQFSVKVATDGNTKMSVFSRGFDKAYFAVEDDDCALMYRQKWIPSMIGATFTINGPLVTFLFERPFYALTATFNVQIESSVTNNSVIELDQPNFITSQGYLGCTARKAFRSSDYSNTSNFRFVADKIASSTATKNARFDVHFDNQNADNSGYLEITDTTNGISEKVSQPTYKTFFFNKTREVSFTNFNGQLPTAFFIRSFPDTNNIAPVDPITPLPTKPTTLPTPILTSGPSFASNTTLGDNSDRLITNPTPSTNYGTPGTKATPSTNYGTPRTKATPSTNYGTPGTKGTPSTNYGTPGTKAIPSTNYGTPGTKATPSSNYGTPGTKATHSTNYGTPGTKATPSTNYGTPGTKATPSTNYGTPGTKATPSTNYGTPGTKATPSTNYGTPGTKATHSTNYGTPGTKATPSTKYGTPGTKATPSSNYGTPGTKVTHSTNYGTPGTKATPSTNYGTPGTKATPSTNYGTPGTKATPSTNYGTPGTKATPSTNYGTPGTKATNSTNYGTPGTKATPSTNYGTPGTKATPSTNYGTPGTKATPSTNYDTPGTKANRSFNDLPTTTKTSKSVYFGSMFIVVFMSLLHV